MRLRNPRGHYPLSLHAILKRLKNAEQDGNIINCFEINVGGRGFFGFWNSMCNSIVELWYPSKPFQAKQELLRSFLKNQHFLCHYPIIENITKIGLHVPKYNSMPQYNPPPDSRHAIKQLYSNCFFRKYNELNLTWWFISITSYWFPVIIPPSCSVWDTNPHFSAGDLKHIDFEGLNFKRHFFKRSAYSKIYFAVIFY